GDADPRGDDGRARRREPPRVRRAAVVKSWGRTVGYLLTKEFRQVSRARVMLFQSFATPLVQLLVLANAATFEVRETTTFVVDESRSESSRERAGRFAASEYFRLVGVSASMRPADREMLAGDVSLILRIPRDFARDLARGTATPVQLVLSAEDGAAAGIV